MQQQRNRAWVSSRERPRAIICDIDNTILTEIDKPIDVACEFLAALHPSIEVHYVTGRPDELRAETLKSCCGDGLLASRSCRGNLLRKVCPECCCTSTLNSWPSRTERGS